MKIVGLEVIRATPAIKTDVLPGEKVSLTYGEKLRVNTSFDCRGPGGKVTLYGAIGVRGATFDEKVKGQASITLPKSIDTFTTVPASVDIGVTADIGPGTDYDLYVKLLEYPEAGRPEVDNIIDITGIPPTFKLLEETIYPYAYIYDGPCDVSIFTFTTIPFTPASWQAGSLAAAVETEVKKAGSRIMEMRVYVDEHLLRPWTNWRIEVTVTPVTSTPTAGRMATDVGPLVWPLVVFIIKAALVIIGILILTWSIISIIKQFRHHALTEEIKKTWSRATLISAIGDFEKWLDRSPTPPEELETQTDQQLRDYCDELATVISPPGINWLPWVIGGVVVLGAGAIAIAMSKKK